MGARPLENGPAYTRLPCPAAASPCAFPSITHITRVHSRRIWAVYSRSFPVLGYGRPNKGLDYRWTRLASCALFRLFASLAVTVLIETGDDENVALVGSDITVPVFIVLSCMRALMYRFGMPHRLVNPTR